MSSRTFRPVSIFTAAALLATSTAWAADEGKKPSKGESKPVNKAELIQKYDRDGDGKLSSDEINAAKAQLGKEGGKPGEKKPDGAKKPEAKTKPAGVKKPDGDNKSGEFKKPDGAKKSEAIKKADGAKKPDAAKKPDGEKKPLADKGPAGNKKIGAATVSVKKPVSKSAAGDTKSEPVKKQPAIDKSGSEKKNADKQTPKQPPVDKGAVKKTETDKPAEKKAEAAEPVKKAEEPAAKKPDGEKPAEKSAEKSGDQKAPVITEGNKVPEKE